VSRSEFGFGPYVVQYREIDPSENDRSGMAMSRVQSTAGPPWHRDQANEDVTIRWAALSLFVKAARPSREVRAGTPGFRRLLSSMRQAERGWSHPPPGAFVPAHAADWP
jgi:hypothetical protein